MLSNNPAMAAGRVELQLLAHNVTEPSRVQVGATADHAVLGQTAQLPGHIGQNIHCMADGVREQRSQVMVWIADCYIML